MKGVLSVSATLQPLEFKKCKIVVKEPLLLWDDRRLFLGDGRFISWEGRPVINATYSKLHSLYLILCEDWKMYVLTENLNLLTKYRWDSKYTVCFQFVEGISAFLMIGVSEIHLQYVDLKCNCRQTKFLSSMKCEINKKQPILSVDESTKLKWHKGSEVLEAQNLLLVWSLQDINFYQLKTLEVLSHIENITKKQVPISKVSYNTLYRYTIVGYSNGTVRLWKIPLNTHQKKQLIHTFEHHIKPIVDLVQAGDPRVFISQSADCKICLWNIDTFQMIYAYDYSEECSEMFMVNHKYFYAINDGTLLKGVFGIALQMVCNINNGIINIDKKYQNITLNQSLEYPITSVQLTLNSNMGLKLDMNDLNNRDVNKSSLQYFHPPLKSKNILQIVSCPFQDNKFYYLVENGEIYRTRIEGTIAKIQTMYNVGNLVSSETATVIKFLRILPPKFDSESIGRFQQVQAIKPSLPYKERDRIFKQKQLLTIGCSKGSVVFVEKDRMDKIYVRISYHREKIVFLESMFHRQTERYFLVSMCEQYLMKIISFQSGKSSCLQSFSCSKDIGSHVCHQDYIFMTFPKGVFQIFKTDGQGQLWYVENEEATDHDDQILSLSLDMQNHLIITAGMDQRIKIWNYSKTHIITINIKQKLHSAFFVNDLNLLIFHQNKLSLLRNRKIQVSTQDISAWKLAQAQQTLLMTFDQYIDGVKKKSIRSRHPNPNSDMEHSSLRRISRKQVVSTPALQPEDMRRSFKKIPNGSAKVKSRKEKQVNHSLNTDYQMVTKHIDNINSIRKTNLEHLPRLAPRKESLFDQFMRAKLLNKKVLTRRDITLNRIIMKNIVKEYLGGEVIEGLNGVKAP